MFVLDAWERRSGIDFFWVRARREGEGMAGEGEEEVGEGEERKVDGGEEVVEEDALEERKEREGWRGRVEEAWRRGCGESRKSVNRSRGGEGGGGGERGAYLRRSRDHRSSTGLENDDMALLGVTDAAVLEAELLGDEVHRPTLGRREGAGEGEFVAEGVVFEDEDARVDLERLRVVEVELCEAAKKVSSLIPQTEPKEKRRREPTIPRNPRLTPTPTPRIDHPARDARPNITRRAPRVSPKPASASASPTHQRDPHPPSILPPAASWDIRPPRKRRRELPLYQPAKVLLLFPSPSSAAVASGRTRFPAVPAPDGRAVGRLGAELLLRADALEGLVALDALLLAFL